MIDISSVSQFFGRITSISKKYETIAKITGEDFNIFNITGIGTSEVKLHSSLIAELLNPCGQHGMGRIFLNHFLKRIQTVDSFNLDFFLKNDVDVSKEEWIGYMDEQKNSGGYIDIILKTNYNNAILIENKIYATDQPRQLRRYASKYKKALIIYLTLNGRPASPKSTCNDEFPTEKINPLCLSYSDFILKWLSECKISAIDKPMIREILNQYIFLIKQITNQNTNSEMENEIVDFITNNSEYIKVAETVCNAQYVIKLSIIKKTIDATFKLAKESNLEPKDWETDSKMGEEDSGFCIDLSNALPLWISFYFRNPDTLEIGIDWIDKNEKDEAIAIKLKEYFALLESNYKIDGWDGWLVWKKMEIWTTTSWSEKQQKMPKQIIEEATNLKEQMKGFKPL